MKKVVSLLVSVLIAVLLTAFAVVPASAEEEVFWVSAYNDTMIEGAGVVFNKPFTDCTWWILVAFAPVEGADNAYEITAMVDGVADGSASPLDVPEGGFVYGLNTGNDWASIVEQAKAAGNLESQWWYSSYQNDPDYYSTNFVNDACNSMIATVRTWSVGDKFVITGIDFETNTPPTSTPDLAWYSDDYVCVATYSVYTGGTELPPESDIPDESELPSESELPGESELPEESVPGGTQDISAVSEPAESTEAVSGSESESSSSSDGISVSGIIALAAGGVVIVAAAVITVAVVLKNKNKNK